MSKLDELLHELKEEYNNYIQTNKTKNEEYIIIIRYLQRFAISNDENEKDRICNVFINHFIKTLTKEYKEKQKEWKHE